MIAPLLRLYLSLPATARGAFFMLIATLVFTGAQLCVKRLGIELHPFEIAFFRNTFGLLVVMPALLRGGHYYFRTSKFHLHALRGLMQAGAMMLMMTALTLGPIAKVVALSYISPLHASIMAVFFLGERMSWARWVALGVGLAGVMIVLRPDVGGIGLQGLLIMTFAFIWACVVVSVKLVSRTDSSVTITLYMGLMMVPISIIPALFVWTWPEGGTWLWLVLLGLLGGLGQLCLAQAFREADATAVLPIDFLSLIWAAGFGYLFFAEVPGVWTLLGGTVIFSAVVFVTWWEARKRQPAEPSP